MPTPPSFNALPWRRPCDYHAISCMDGKTIQCLPNSRNIYLSNFNSFRVIRCLSQCVNPKIAILPHFCLPWGRRCRNHAKRCMNENTIQCLPNPSQHLPIYVQQFSSYSNRKCRKSPFLRTAAHIFVSLETPLRLSRNVLHRCNDNLMLTKLLAACTCLSSIVSELYYV